MTHRERAKDLRRGKDLRAKGMTTHRRRAKDLRRGKDLRAKRLTHRERAKDLPEVLHRAEGRLLRGKCLHRAKGLLCHRAKGRLCHRRPNPQEHLRSCRRE